MPDLEVDGEESESELEDEEGDNVVVMEEEDVGAEDDEGDGEGEAEEKWRKKPSNTVEKKWPHKIVFLLKTWKTSAKVD